MTKSPALAEAALFDRSPAGYYLWEVTGKPVSVHLSLEVVDRLEGDMQRSFRSITARGSEVGGLLLGHTEADGGYRVIVDDYELFACAYTRGPLYLLSEEEKARLADGMRSQASRVLGFFRSNTRKDLALDNEDVALYREYFSRPEQIFLLVKPYAAKPGTAGIFIWENSQVRGEASYGEFPFRRSELGNGDLAKSIAKAGTRASVLPFLIKRDAEPLLATRPSDREDPVPVMPETSKALAEAPQPAHVVVLPPPPEIKATISKPAERLTLPAVPPPVPFDADLRLGRSAIAGKKLWLGVGGLTVILAAGAWMYVQSQAKPGNRVTEGAPLQLRAERFNGQLLVTWNGDAETIRRARGAVLSINDGAQKKDLRLEPAQLRSGSVMYAPVTSEVSFLLDVTDSKTGKSRREVLRVLSAVPNAAVDPKKPSPQLPPLQTTESTAAQPPEPSAEDAQQEQSPAAEPRKQFQPMARVQPSEQTQIPEAPAVIGAGEQAAPAPVPFVNPPAAPTPVIPQTPPAPVQTQAPPAVRRPVATGAKLEPSKLLRRIEPAYPPMARQARVAGRVRMRGTIGKDGKVRDVQVLSGPPLLCQAAKDAVYKWTYSPSLLNGLPIESTTDVDLNFALNSSR